MQWKLGDDAARETKLINVKVVNLRKIGYDNLKEWIDDKENNVYIGRKGIVFINKQRFPTTDSVFANPFKINESCTREQVVEQYEIYIRNKLKDDPSLMNTLKSMKGKTLGCWCSPELCHGNVLIKLINDLYLI